MNKHLLVYFKFPVVIRDLVKIYMTFYTIKIKTLNQET